MTCPPSPGVFGLQFLALLLSLLASVTAWMLARSRRDHVPVAVALTAVSLADLIGTVLHAAVPTLDCVGPYTGVTRIAFYVDQARYLVWPAAVGALSVIVAAKLPARRVLLLVFLAWSALNGYLSGTYPDVRGPTLRRVYLGVQLVALAAGVAAFGAWVRRGGLRAGAPAPAVVVAALIVGTELASLAVGPWTRGLFGEAYQTEQVMVAVLYAVIAAVQGGATWRLFGPPQ